MASFPMVYRLWARVRLREAEEEGCGDPADFEHGGVKGRSAMEAVFDSALEAELQGCKGDAAAVCLLLDLSKCYERIPLRMLAERAQAAGWPSRCVALAVGQYASQRWVSVSGCVADGGHTTCGVVAGCGWAVKFLGDFLRPAMREGLQYGRTLEAFDLRHADGRLTREEIDRTMEAYIAARTYVDDIRLEARGRESKLGPSSGTLSSGSPRRSRNVDASSR